MSRHFLLVDPLENPLLLKALAAPVRIGILKLLQVRGALNVNELAELLAQPQSSVSIHVQMLQEAGLIATETVKARKGSQKICRSLYDEILIRFEETIEKADPDAIEVAMPLGLYTGFEVSAPCGLCSSDGIIGLLDVPSTFLDPDRMKAGLIWFTRGYVEYQFPNNARLANLAVREVEFVLELSSEVPGTSADWPSDITLTVNGTDVVTWTSPGDFGDKRGAYTPDWWKLKGSQYGKLKSFRIREDGTYVDGLRLSDVTLADLDLTSHHSIRLRIGVMDDARHPGGINIFGRGFGNYDQDILMRLKVR
ncbi:ArsR family transcriptional regulator [Rhizobium rhizosphaerae]|uniref:ArsR family transcriptional regulator n=1 Tax=Xaviernesmea rhizosphaerae TaxID=1672749 RepID=A0A1Q9ANI4_9HYPH|nr:helix-turn-helix domain-containing protein [Xaviernesmea rhizosphaerae]OLP56972.1 ArsR family transcriptional regulator [Xaviernesmea rhizosphaerae]